MKLLPSILVVCACFGASPALAQSASDKAAAEALFREGRRLLDAGQYPAACAKLLESQRLDPAPGTLLNLGGCYEKNGQTASAWATFKEAMSASHLKGRTDWENLARSRSLALEPKLSRLTITVSSTADGLQVRRDGEAVGQAEWGTAIPVDPGTHVVEAQAPHRKPFKQSVDVAGGGANAAVAVTELAADDGSGPGPSTGDPGSTQRMIGLVVGGVGLVSLGVGSAFGLVAMGKENDATHNHCQSDGVHCDSTGLQLGQDAHTDATASTVFFVVGGAALAGGLVLYFTAPKGDGAPTTVGLRAAPTRGGAAFGLEGAW
jgi:hypothetical protein